MDKNRQWTVAFIGGGIVFMLLALAQFVITDDYTPAILGFGAVLLFGLHLALGALPPLPPAPPSGFQGLSCFSAHSALRP